MMSKVVELVPKKKKTLKEVEKITIKDTVVF